MPRDLLLLAEMIEAGERIGDLVTSRDAAGFEADRDARDALLWNYTVLGEAAVLYDLRSRIMAPGILDATEVAKAAEAYFGIEPEKRNLKVIHANLDPAVLRFEALDAETQGEFKDAVDQFTRAYAFLAQVMPFTDPALEQLYVYVKALRTLLRDAASGGLDLGDDLVLTHLRLLSNDATEIALAPGEIEPGTALPGGGHGGGGEVQRDSLAEIIAAINERFGTDLDDRDRLEVEKVELTLQADEELRTFANANTLESFALEFGPKFKSAVLDTESHTQRLYDLLLSKPELAKIIEAEVMRTTYEAMRSDVGTT